MTLPVDEIADLLASLGAALARQRSVLEQGQLDQLASLNAELESCYARIADFPGGQPALLARVASESESRRSSLRTLLLQLDTDNRVNGELIRITMHRVAAIQDVSDDDDELEIPAFPFPSRAAQQLSVPPSHHKRVVAPRPSRQFIYVSLGGGPVLVDRCGWSR